MAAPGDITIVLRQRQPSNINASGSFSSGFSGSFAESGTLSLLTNTPFYLSMQPKTNIASQGGLTASATALVDTTFQIGSGVADPQEFTPEFSPGIGNTSPAASAVPEPVSWMGMLSASVSSVLS